MTLNICITYVKLTKQKHRKNIWKQADDLPEKKKNTWNKTCEKYIFLNKIVNLKKRHNVQSLVTSKDYVYIRICQYLNYKETKDNLQQ